MCYIIYYETKYAKNEEDFLPTSIDESLLEIWDFGCSINICKCNKVRKQAKGWPVVGIRQPPSSLYMENAWIISSGICKAGKAIMMTRAWAKCCCHVHGSISPEMWENQRFGLRWDCGQQNSFYKSGVARRKIMEPGRNVWALMYAEARCNEDDHETKMI